MKTNMIRRLGIALGVIALTTMLWGCSSMAPTSPNDTSLQPAGKSATVTEAEPDQWW